MTDHKERRNRISIAAPVKINLALHVTGQRADGYHRLESLVVFSPDGDRLEIEKAACDSFSMDGAFAAALGSEGGNLVLKARNILRAVYGEMIGATAIRLTKNVPVSSGIGGGSGDAAATLAGLMDLWGCAAEPQNLSRLALALGADVPMCLAGLQRQCAFFAGGIGDELGVLINFPALHLVLVNPVIAVSTSSVFGALTNCRNTPLVFERRRSYTLADVVTLLENSRNDLYETACHHAPVLADVLDCLRTDGALFARMSGSGATCFGLYPTQKAAEAAAASIRRQNPGYFVLATETFGMQN
ncbi:MAG: 4-diphosphocytidyl-2-C-methyl-D-erythritol kinase [Candidatus Tokpelaia hoelldobleri]|uniref:4-diphosphocytidyl-2-C-methyl-D-erythritol kinase n=1 Tax=Candidatus Tokpelaia hoelldobleri TaxID=1902579 RepID=A0A1U9JT97_9HYPH|nr:MAG: 4-diphosphocytidyl-2-C-methyl-D-erythritol kinase [Candidatus Tokpelaia hoelldoblerii]